MKSEGTNEGSSIKVQLSNKIKNSYDDLNGKAITINKYKFKTADEKDWNAVIEKKF